MSVTWSQAAQSSDDASALRHLSQYYMHTGQEQYDRGSYDQAVKSFQMAQKHRDALEPADQARLQSLLDKANAAVAGQRQAPTAEALRAGSGAPAVRPTNVSTSGTPAAPAPQPVQGQLAPAVGVTALANTPADPNATSSVTSEVERIADLYTRSVELYAQGELLAARQGFEEVAKSGLFKGAEGKRPEDYIVTIDRLLAASQPAQVPAPTPGTPVTATAPTTPEPALVAPLPGPQVTTLTNGPVPAEQGGSIEVINRRREIIRSYMEAVVNDAVTQAQRDIGQNQFDAAMDRIANAQREVNENQFYLGEDLYKQYTQTLNQTAERIQQARADRDKERAEQKRIDSAEAQNRLRTQAETDRANRINELMERAKAYWKQQQYEAAQGQLDSLLAIDPLNDEALTLKQMVEDMVYMRKQWELDELSQRQRTAMLHGADESTVPYADEITYPKDWREVMLRPTRKSEEPFQLDPANVQVYKQLETEVDLSQLTPQTPLSTAIDMLRTSVVPPLNIVVLWRDLQDNVAIDPTSPINMDGLPKVRLSTALDNLVKAISDPLDPTNPVDYVVNKGVVTIATTLGLPQRKMETRVYDIADLIGQAANYAQMGQMMGMFGGMMSSGAGITNYNSIIGGGTGGTGGTTGGSYGGGGFGGGMGGGMMGGMGGGMMGGMGGGMMGGMGGMGMMGGMGGMGMGGMGMGGMGMGGMGMGGMGGGMGGMGGGMGGYGGGMGGYGMGMGGGGSYALRQLIEESVNPNSWLDISTDPMAQGQITLYPMDVPKKMAVYNTPEAHQQITDLLEQLRKSLGHEVSIEARFLIVSQNFLKDIGLDFDVRYNAGGKVGLITLEQGSFLAGAPDTSTKVPGSLGGLVDSAAATLTGGYGTDLDDLQVRLLLRATEGRSDATSLSAPKVTVMSGEGASFTIQDLVAFALPPTTTTTTAVGAVGSGATAQSSFNNIYAAQVGSTLSITPTITQDKKYVILNIVSQQIDLLRMRTLQVQQANTSTTVGAPPTVTTSVTVPETETSNVATRVSVPDRGTLLLGGHKLTAKVDKEVGVPILSKIPILGRLFSNRSSISDEKILLILVKPTIILQEETEHEAVAAMEQLSATVRP